MTVELGTTIVLGRRNDEFSLNSQAPRTGDSFLDDDLLHNIIFATTNVERWLYANKYRLDQQYEKNLTTIDSEIDQAIKDNGGVSTAINTLTKREVVTQEKNIVVKLYLTEKSKSESKNKQSSALYGNHNFDKYKIPPSSDFVTWSFSVYIQHNQLLDWAHSYEAARLAQVYAEKARRLEERAQVLAAIEAEQERLQVQQQKALEQARTAEAKAKREADELARLSAEKIKSANTFRNHGSLAASASTVAVSAGLITTIEGASLSLQVAIRSAISAVGALVAGAVSGLLVGVSALVYSPRLANGELPERFMLNSPLSDLVPKLPDDLALLAHSGGSIELPFRLGTRTGADGHVEMFVAKTDVSAGVPNKVRVVAAIYDPDQNVFSVTTGHVPPRTLTWTPIVNPGNSSTSLPGKQVVIPVYAGASVTPIEGRLDPHPGLAVSGFDDFITVFPMDSGMPPVYVMFSSPYSDATTRGAHSGREYNPDNAGGPTQSLDWASAVITQKGIDEIKLHIGRFETSDGNKVMIERLGKIQRGELNVTDTDKRFYTHELRELERYRSLGIKDGTNDNSIWNNAHTATLEDFRLKDDFRLFYTSEAIAAEDKQIGSL